MHGGGLVEGTRMVEEIEDGQGGWGGLVTDHWSLTSGQGGQSDWMVLLKVRYGSWWGKKVPNVTL